MPRGFEASIIFFFLSLQWVMFYAVVMNEVLPSPLVLYVFSFGEQWVTRPLPHSGNTRAAAFESRVSGH